jgi:hypothetical protein
MASGFARTTAAEVPTPCVSEELSGRIGRVPGLNEAAMHLEAVVGVSLARGILIKPPGDANSFLWIVRPQNMLLLPMPNLKTTDFCCANGMREYRNPLLLDYLNFALPVFLKDFFPLFKVERVMWI